MVELPSGRPKGGCYNIILQLFGNLITGRLIEGDSFWPCPKVVAIVTSLIEKDIY